MPALNARHLPRYRSPAYPARLAVRNDPALLVRHMPKGWLSRRELVSLASGLLLTGGGCGKSEQSPAADTGLDPSAPAVVAPLFEHGAGRGAAGCIVVAPPVHLSEEEALQVIREELGPHGVELTLSNVELTPICVTVRERVNEHEWVSGDAKRGITEFEEPFAADGLDPKRRVAVEFTSADDYWRLAGPWHEGAYVSTVISYSTKEAAGFVADVVRDQPAGVRMGVFYDPLVRWNETSRRAPDPDGSLERGQGESRFDVIERQAKEESKALLREQVQDFVEWLKGQGVI